MKEKSAVLVTVVLVVELMASFLVLDKDEELMVSFLVLDKDEMF